MKEWQLRYEKSVWHPFSPLKGVAPNIHVARGEGPYLITEDGRRILDAISSWWVNLHGHSHPDIIHAIKQQAELLEHVIFAGFTHSPGIELAEFLKKIFPGDYERVFFSDNGSTAVEVAVKLALQFWYNKKTPRKKIIALDGAYHGDTFGAMAVGERSIFTKPFFPFLFEVEFIPLPDESVIKQFQKIVDSGDVAAFIFEPLIQGASGMRMYSAEILDQLIQIAQESDVICIADEVMTGFGRTGRNFATEYLSNHPDMVCLSKGLTGGALPLGATLCNEKILEPFLSDDLKEAFLHGHSYTANPMACAAGLASGKLLIRQDCQENITRITLKHNEFVKRLSRHPRLTDIGSMGTILALEFESDSDSSYLSEMRNAMYPYFLDRDILLRPLGNLIYVLPPYVTRDHDLDKVYGAIEEFLLL